MLNILVRYPWMTCLVKGVSEDCRDKLRAALEKAKGILVDMIWRI
jgi:hypothetical protein